MKRTGDVISAVVAEDPDAIYRLVLRQGGMFRDDSRASWVAAHLHDVVTVLRSEQCGVRPPGEPIPHALVDTDAGAVFGRMVRMTDGAFHASVKRAVTEVLAGLDPATIRTVAADQAAVVLMESALDRFLEALPVRVVASLLGVPADDLSVTVNHTTCFVRALTPQATRDDLTRGIDGARHLRSCFDGLLSQPDVPPMLDALRGALSREGHDDIDIAIANAIGLLVQAHDATAGLIGNTLVRLVRQPNIARTRASITRLVADVARVDPAVHNTRRYALEDVCIGGVDICRGETIVVSLAAANLADDQQSWSFGEGRHACPGSAMASIIATEAVIGVCERGVLPDRLPEPLTYRPLANVRIPYLTDSAGKDGRHDCGDL